jgi:hypothetical protein
VVTCAMLPHPLLLLLLLLLLLHCHSNSTTHPPSSAVSPACVPCMPPGRASHPAASGGAAAGHTRSPACGISANT